MTTVGCVKLTPEELKELQDLEKDAKKLIDEEAIAIQRQHLDALRLAKKLSTQHGRPGHDFVVLETKVGNVAVRKPLDVELDKLGENADARESHEDMALSIVLEPSQDALRPLMAKEPGLSGAIVLHALQLVKVMREEEAKK